jgi:hypothetical protein
MEELQNFTLIKLHEKLALTEQEFGAWIEGMGLLHSRRTCECGGARIFPNVFPFLVSYC